MFLDQKGRKETLELTVKMENLGHQDPMDHQGIEVLQDCQVQMDHLE